MTTAEPRASVSICIPTYNGARTIGATLLSVLSQKHTPLEVVVADDASEDDTLKIVSTIADDRVRVLSAESNIGAARNWNRGVAASTGDLVKVMGQDDLLYPGCIAEQAAACVRAPSASFVASRRDIIGPSGEVLLRDRGLRGLDGVVERDEVIPVVVRSGTNPIGEPVTVLFRRAAFDRCGGFSPDASYVIDLRLWLSLLQAGPMVAMRSTACAFRVSDFSWSSALAKDQARQVRGLLRDVAAEAAAVPRATALAGWVKAGLYGRSRSLLYLWYRRGKRAAVRRP